MDKRVKDYRYMKAAYMRVFSAKVLMQAGRKYRSHSFESFLQQQVITRECINKLRLNMQSREALLDLKREFTVYKTMYAFRSRKSRGQKGRPTKTAEALKKLNIEDVPALIAEADMRQYCEHFDGREMEYFKPKRLVNAKNFTRRIRRETLLDIYKSIVIADNIRLKIEESLLENPRELYPAARAMKRRFIIHSGMTNTGKTYNALKALKKAETGVYLGPLRLLAMEVQEKLLFDGVMCSLRTGEEEDIVRYETHMSSTVEMVNLHALYDAAVIDECQMIADKHRGCAWTRAILGVRAEKVHLCTAPDAVDILIKIIRDCGDEYEIISYKRREPIEYDNSLATGDEIMWTNEDGSLRKPTCAERLAGIRLDELKYGDALIAFSRADVLEIAEILRQKGIEPSVIYGALPYNTRKKQLKRFTDRETGVVIATDAIGMGLNLPVRRIIFTTVHKFDGERYRRLSQSEIKQIAGRAGRKGIYDKGYVYSVEDAEYINDSLTSRYVSIEKAYIDFDTAFIDMEYGMGDILLAWREAALPFDIYEKINVDLTIRLIRFVERICREKGLKCSKEDEYALATIHFDESSGEVFGAWVEYVREYLGGAAELSLPLIKKDTTEDLEISFKRVDLYYNFCRVMGYAADLEWIRDIKEYLADEINYRLLNKM